MQGNNPISWRYNVRLDDVVKQRGSLGAVAGDQGVGSQRAAFGLHGAHGDDVRVVARRSDGRIAAGAHGVVPAIVAGGGDNDDPLLPSGLDGLAQGVQRIALEHLPSERQVHDPNVQFALEVDGHLNGGDYPAVGSLAVLVENAQVN